MTGRKLSVASIISSLPCALVCMLYLVFPAPLNNLMWCMFVGYCTSYLSGARLKALPRYWANYSFGIVWALAYWFLYALLLCCNIPAPLSMFVDVLIVTAAICIVAFGPLKSTILNCVPLYFPTVFTLFASGGDFSVYPWMVLSVFLGSLTAVIGNEIWLRIEKGEPAL